MSTVIGIDVGGTKIAAGVVGDAVHDVRSVPTATSAEAIIDAIVSLVSDIAAGQSPAAIGIGSAGAFDAEGRVVSATDLLPGWSGTALATRVRERTGAPTAAINDVHAAAIGEARRGAAADARHVLIAAVGTGLGGAVIHEGQLELGHAGLAGSLGHVMSRGPARRCSCGVAGHAEALASGPGIARLYAEKTGDPVDLRAIASRATAGDADAVDAIRIGGEALGDALAAAAAIADPEVIVIGGGAAQVGALLLEPARRAFRQTCMPAHSALPIIPAALGTSAALVGAALLARERYVGAD